MGTLTAHLTQSSSVSFHHSSDEEAGAQREELTFVTLENEEEAEPFCDIRGLVLRNLYGNRRGCVLLGFCGSVTFTAAFLLAFVVFSGRYHCSQVGGLGEQSEQEGAGANKPSDGGSGLYLGELREMMRRLLQYEDIYNTVRWISRANHPPGSSEGTALASEVLGRFRKLPMDHTWTESLYATLQFPDR
ncbi:hypothetical protein AMECASPLE_038159 [Ameca splendens]|uniref:Uncharacterized protein n=1 Tax=Ameca splendens TaxID=208324 RepID=A0ABV0ZJC0_9TELE